MNLPQAYTFPIAAPVPQRPYVPQGVLLPQQRKSVKKEKPSPFTGNETAEEAMSICKAKNKIFRRGYTRGKGEDAVIIEPACVRKKGQGKKSTKKSPKKSCSSGKVYRKSYVASSGKRVSPKCVKKGGRKSTKKSPKKSQRSSPRKSPKKCPSGKVYRKSYIVKSSGKRVSAKCVKSVRKNCPEGMVYRKGYKSPRGKKIPPKCVKKATRK